MGICGLGRPHGIGALPRGFCAAARFPHRDFDTLSSYSCLATIHLLVYISVRQHYGTQFIP